MTKTLDKDKKKHIVVGILAHVDSGKTTLSEAMLYTSGKLRTLGRVDHQDAFLDTEEQERERGITIFSKQAEFAYKDMDITLLDTPGHVDFSTEMERTLQVLDYAILVINGMDGVQSHTDTLWKLLIKYQVPVFLFINKMDMSNYEQDQLLEDLRHRLDDGCVDFCCENVYEQIAMCREDLLETYLETGLIPLEDIQNAILHRDIFPCFFGSALKLTGVEALLDGMKRYVKEPTYPKDFAARVFKISRDAKGERLTYLKVTGGSLKCKTTIDHSEDKIHQIRIYSGTSFETFDEVKSGTVCAVTGLTQTYVGEGLGIETEDVLPMLTPVLSYRLIYPEKTDVFDFLKKVKQLEEENPELSVVWQESSKEIHIRIMGPIQLEVLKQLIWQRYRVDVSFGPGQIAYRETLKYPVMGVGHFEPLRHYAEVHLLMEPLEPGSGLQFDSICSEDQLDKNWQRLIFTHLEEIEHPGVLTGAPITDMKITITAGRAHNKHTEGGDFRQATYRAVRQGLMMGECVLLEPVYAFVMQVPADTVGRAMADVNRMYGTIEPLEVVGDIAILKGTAPVATMKEYHQELMAYTHGNGSLACTFKGYVPCHNEEEVLAASSYMPEEDMEHPSASVFCAHGAGYLVDWYDVYDYMHIKEDKGFALADMEEIIEQDEEVELISSSSSKKKGRHVGMNAGVYDEKELEDIFIRTYGAKNRENETYNRAGFHRYHKQKNTDYKTSVGYQQQNADNRTLQSGSSGNAVKRSNKQKKTGKEYLLVDGYNIIFAWDDLKELAAVNMDSARGKLMDILSNYQGYMGCELILVFDAYKVKQNPGEITKYHNIYVVYTKEAETADMYIEKTTHELGRTNKVTVATSDALEQLIIMGQGALRMSARGLKEEIERVNAIIRETYLDKD